MILEVLQLFAVEVRIAAHNPRRVDKRHATLERRAGGIGECVRNDAGLPAQTDEPCLTSQLGRCLLDEPRLQASAREGDDRRDEQEYQDQRAEEESFGECHAYVRYALTTNVPSRP